MNEVEKKFIEAVEASNESEGADADESKGKEGDGK